jgi:hypothetical protein
MEDHNDGTGLRTISWFEKRGNGPWERKAEIIKPGEDHWVLRAMQDASAHEESARETRA